MLVGFYRNWSGADVRIPVFHGVHCWTPNGKSSIIHLEKGPRGCTLASKSSNLLAVYHPLYYSTGLLPQEAWAQRMEVDWYRAVGDGEADHSVYSKALEAWFIWEFLLTCLSTVTLAEYHQLQLKPDGSHSPNLLELIDFTEAAAYWFAWIVIREPIFKQRGKHLNYVILVGKVCSDIDHPNILALVIVRQLPHFECCFPWFVASCCSTPPENLEGPIEGVSGNLETNISHFRAWW